MKEKNIQRALDQMSVNVHLHSVLLLSFTFKKCMVQFQTTPVNPLEAIAETFLMLLTIFVLIWSFYVFGKYRVFDKDPPRLSKLCPYLDDIDPKTPKEKEWIRIRELLRPHFARTSPRRLQKQERQC